MNEQPITRPVNFIRFHGLNLLVLAFDGVEYVAAQPLTNLAGMDWKGAKRNLSEPENAALYGTMRIPAPEIAGARGPSFPRGDMLCIRLDRARMFLARISTRQMKAQGNAEAADRLLALQIEWAKVLHDYETNGYAAKPGVTRDLIGLIKARQATTHPGERAALTTLIADTCAAMGYPIPANPQQQLPL